MKAELSFRKTNENMPAPPAKTWLTPAGALPNLYAEFLRQPHLFLAAPPGNSRRSLRDGLIYAALFNAPCHLRLIVLDLAEFGMLRFRELPHTKGYTRHPVTAVEYLRRAVDMMEKRLAAGKGVPYPALWIILDGLDTLPAEQKKAAAPMIRKILERGRRADVHLLAIAAVMNGSDAAFPAHAFLLGDRVSYRTAEKTGVSPIPLIEEGTIDRQIRWWLDQKEGK